MAERIRSSSDEPPPVWPAAHGRVIRGQSLEPFHPAAIEAAPKCPELSELLSLLDSLRAVDIRIRTVASDLLKDRLRAPAPRPG